MLNAFTDIETLPQDGSLQEYIDKAKENIKVPSDLTKPKLMSALGCTDKYKTVGELKDMWVERFGLEQAKVQGEETWRKTSFDGAKGSICVISAAIEQGEIITFDALEGGEKVMLVHFWQWLGDMVSSSQWRFVAHNAKFDLPFIYHRSVINRVKPLHFNPHGRHGQHHYCTMEAWAGFGNRISLDNLAKALGIEGKGDIDGSMVYDTWITNPEKVIAYCPDDVRITREIYNRLEFINV